MTDAELDAILNPPPAVAKRRRERIFQGLPTTDQLLKHGDEQKELRALRSLAAAVLKLSGSPWYGSDGKERLLIKGEPFRRAQAMAAEAVKGVTSEKR